jgi:hypothetical protein
LIDTENLESIPLCEQNLNNSTFVAGYIGEQLSEGPEYAVISRVEPENIMGAMPSSKEAAFALGVKENSFIKNPAYKKIFDCEKVQQAIGREFSLIVPERLNINPDLPLNEVYQRYKQAEESNNQQATSSLGASSSQNRSSVIFFRGNIDKFPSQETSKSPHP